ncbi:MAG: pyridoxal phosphate-dependent aminotransferase [Candidatus Puniceispirillaceae bacterium]
MFNPANERLGTESAFTVLARATALAAAGNDIINLGIGQPDFATPPHITEAAIKAIRDGYHGYTPSMGMPILREAVQADVKARYGAHVPVEQIQIMPGGKPTMFFACMILGGAGTEIILPDPGFPIYHSAINYSGARPVPYGLSEEKGYAFDADDVLSKITDKTSLIIINSPANPTGGVTPKSELDKLVKGLADFPHVHLLSDEIYDRLAFEGAPISLSSYPEIADRLIILNGWSKTYAMTGWRAGYAIWPKSMTDYADRLAVNIHSCVNAPTQMAALAATTGPQDCVEDMRAAFARRAQVTFTALNQLDGVSCPMPKGAFYAFANIQNTGLTAREFQDKALDSFGVALIAGTSFGAQGEGYVRLSVANSDTAITNAIKRLSDMISHL